MMVGGLDNYLSTNGAATLTMLLCACGGGNSKPSDHGNAPATSINGRVAPDVNGNNRDQPLATAPVAPPADEDQARRHLSEAQLTASTALTAADPFTKL